MKRIFSITTVLFLSICFVSCSSDNSGDNDSSSYTWFSQSEINDVLWIVQNVSDKKYTTYNHNDLVPGYKVKFYSNGTCKSSNSMQTGWTIESGKIKTYYAKTNEPMYVYTLISQNEDNLVVKMEGTLDDDLSATLTIKKIIEPEYVDFGLPSRIKWATRNLGADYSKEVGTPYKYQSTNIARTEWGGSWYIPSVEDYQELFQYCTKEWYIEDGKPWCKLSRNDKSIIFPCDESIYNGNTGVSYYAGDYWTTSTMKDLGKTNAILFSIEEKREIEANCLMTSNVTGYIRPIMK